MIANRIRVLVIDDSAVVRGLLTRSLEADVEIVVAGTAMHGEAALIWLRKHEADVVICDVEMPVKDGIATLTAIHELLPDLPVIMASSLTTSGAETTIRALSLGAVGCVAKPQSNSLGESIDLLSRELVPLVKAVARKRTARTPAARAAAVTARPTRRTTPPQILAIGTSTGGPQALSRLLSRLPRDFPLPIVIVQHMPPMFTPMLAKHLEKDTGRPCAEAIDGEALQGGHTYVAPGDYHFSLVRRQGQVFAKLDQEVPEHYCRPSVNPLFRSVADCYGAAALAVMLTGMGEDGIEGTRRLQEAGGYVIAQDEESSVVWGMPGAVVRAQLAQECLPLDNIAPRILTLTQAKVFSA